MFPSMGHKSNLWDKDLTAHLNQSVHVHLTSLRFTDVLKIKNTILMYFFFTHSSCMHGERLRGKLLL